MAQQTATERMTATIHWSNNKSAVDDSEPLTGCVVEDSKGKITIKDDGKEVYHRVIEASNGADIVESMLTLQQRSRDTHIKGTVDDVEVSL